jgi:hypothetical protein
MRKRGEEIRRSCVVMGYELFILLIKYLQSAHTNKCISSSRELDKPSYPGYHGYGFDKYYYHKHKYRENTR